MNHADSTWAALMPALMPAPHEAAEPSGQGGTILVVDDTPSNLAVLSALLAPRWRVQLAPNGNKALELARRQAPDLVLLDVMMPGLDGWEVCRRLKADPLTAPVPVLFITALAEPEDEARAFACGGADFITKPFNPGTVLARVATQLQAKAWRDSLAQRSRWLETELERRLGQVEQLREATLHVMISFAEFRDEDTGQHVKRTQEYVRTLALWLRGQPGGRVTLSDEEIDHIAKSAPLHDIGKVAIPDGILLKPGRLTADEWTVMKTHALQGWEMLRRAGQRMGREGSAFLRHGMDIARHHHERWDGSGYPDGLAGEAIPLSARLMAVADVYDALISRRPYKEPMSHDEAVAYVRQQAGSHFDPQVVEALVATQQRLRAIADEFADEMPATPAETPLLRT
jgi:putative two-component system response regulator